MDSPVFGSGNHHSILAPTLKRDFLSSYDNQQQNQNIQIIYQIQSNIRKFMSMINSKIIMRNKRAGFHMILNNNKSKNNDCKQITNCIIFTQRKLSSMICLIEREKIRRKIKAWQKIKVFCHNLVLQEEIKTSTLQFENKLIKDIQGRNKSKKKKVSELKENSSNNIQDTIEQNKRLKSQILNQQTQFDSFAEKMNTLLDAYNIGKHKC